MTYRENLQQATVASAKRVIIKIGSSLIAPPTGNTESNSVDLTMIESLAGEILFLRQRNIEVILVSSGAVAMGRYILGKVNTSYLPKTAPAMSRKQALSAIGQARLISLYGEVFAKHKLPVSQILITARDFRDRKAYLNIGHTIEELLSLGVIPIINENDTVSTDELRFGDNDLLSGACAALLHADLLILLTSADGFLMNKNRVPALDTITADVIAQAGGPSGPGSGGMRTKIRSGQLALRTGFQLAILPGRHKDPIRAFFEGDNIGTLIGKLTPAKMNARKMWLLFARTKGAVIVDHGASLALQKHGSSLLSAGITKIKGDFVESDVIEIIDTEGKVIGRGIAKVSWRDIEAAIQSGQHLDIEVIHRNDLILDSQ